MLTTGCCKVNNKKQRFVRTAMMHIQGEAVPFHGTFSLHVENRELGVSQNNGFGSPQVFLLDIDALGDH